MGWGGGFLDYDNDGYLDLFVTNGFTSPARTGDASCVGQQDLLYHNRGDGIFQDWTKRAGLDMLDPKAGRGAAFGDYDNDGDVDIFLVPNNGRATLLRNEGGNRNNWIKFTLRGTVSNRDSTGARVEILTRKGLQIREISAGSSYLSQHSLEVVFGLGNETMVERIRVGWPSGITLVRERWTANQSITLTEPRL
ncbi:CRTAC1 family protein [Acidobacteriota bacterium]